MRTYLDFEKPVAELEAKVEELRAMGESDSAVAVGDEISRLEVKAAVALKELYADLTPWQKTQVARHPQRPHCLDYIAGLIEFENGVRGIVECGEGAPDVPEVDQWWRKCRIGAQGTEGFAEVLTGGGWRAITRDSTHVLSGPGGMDYAHDTPPYVQQMADWLDDEAQVHPCNGESAYKGFEIMMAICRSAVQRGKVSLPLGPGEPELEALRNTLP